MKTFNKLIAFCIGLMVVISCNQTDPVEEANKLNESFAGLISRINSNDSPLCRYSQLICIQKQGDSLLTISRSAFKKKKLELFIENITEIDERQDYKDAWIAMSKDNIAKLKSFPVGVWMVNSDSLTANSIFKIDKKRESIIPYNIDSTIPLSVREYDGLVYTEGYDSPIFFDYVDSTKKYTITTADGISGSFRKANRPDLSMGHYSYVYSYDADYDGAETIDVYSGHAYMMGKDHKISFTDEKFWGYNFEEMEMNGIGTFCHADKFSRNGCYDCWALIDNSLKMNFKWKRVKEENARNFLFIFGKQKEEWQYVEYTSTTSNETISSSVDGEDWDKILDSYEKYVDKYISLLKKANKGDTSALTEYMSFMEKATELSEKLSNAESDMSTAQMNRYLSITQKMSSAAATMQ